MLQESHAQPEVATILGSGVSSARELKNIVMYIP